MVLIQKGYETFYLPGEKSLFHGGTAGDIDNDGDIDIVVTPGPKNEIIAYLNNGKGKFKTKKILKNRNIHIHFLRRFSPLPNILTTYLINIYIIELRKSRLFFDLKLKSFIS